MTLCLERVVADCDFFINKRDFPVVKNDMTEPYHHIWGRYDQPLTSYKPTEEQFAPVLGFNTTPNHIDIPIPTTEDWRLITGYYFGKSCSKPVTFPDEIPWEERYSKAFFRGSATGCGVDADENQRIHLVTMANQFEKEGKDILDAGITSWAIRDKKIMGSGMKFIRPTTGIDDLDKNATTNLNLADFVPMNRQIQYK